MCASIANILFALTTGGYVFMYSPDQIVVDDYIQGDTDVWVWAEGQGHDATFCLRPEGAST